MDKAGQTVSATEFAELTGLSRERLRTWERRFGFPEPHRVGRGPRRYALADAARVLAVRRAAEQGVPLGHAIDAAAAPDGGEAPVVGAATLAAAAGAAPTAVVLVAGPHPLRVAYLNDVAARRDARAGAIAVGEELDLLPWFLGSDLERTLRSLFAGSTPALECQHPAWDGSDATERSVAYRVPLGPDEPPVVALVGVEDREERHAQRQLGLLREQLTQMRGRQRRLDRWVELTASLAERFQREADEGVLGIVASTIVRGLGAVDAGIAGYATGALALRESSRGVLATRPVTVTGYEDLATLMHSGVPGWLAPATGTAFGVPAGMHGLAVPIVVVGETLGLLLIVFDGAGELDDDARRLLAVVSAGLGFVLLRDRLVVAGRDSQAPDRRAAQLGD